MSIALLSLVLSPLAPTAAPPPQEAVTSCSGDETGIERQRDGSYRLAMAIAYETSLSQPRDSSGNYGFSPATNTSHAAISYRAVLEADGSLRSPLTAYRGWIFFGKYESEMPDYDDVALRIALPDGPPLSVKTERIGHRLHHFAATIVVADSHVADDQIVSQQQIERLAASIRTTPTYATLRTPSREIAKLLIKPAAFKPRAAKALGWARGAIAALAAGKACPAA